MRSVLSSLMAFLAMTAPGSASSFSVSPIQVRLDPNGRAETIRLWNDGAEPVVVQVSAVDWIEGQPLSEASPTNDLLAAPPVFEFEPGANQVIRLALRRPLDGKMERTYRLVITEVPDEVSGDGVAVALRLDLPVFATPPGAAPEAVWTVRRMANGTGELRLANRGTAHLQVRELTLSDPASGRMLLDPEAGDRVLAGHERTWRFDASGLGSSAQLRIKAATNAGELDTVVPLQSG